MRVITGIARGRCLETLEGNEVRPTSDKVKEAIFSAIQFDLPGTNVLDLFCGSGQLGIEALSRGAKYSVFVDKNKDSIEITKKNIETVGFSEISKVIQMDSLNFLKQTKLNFDIVFIDPPYNHGLIESALELLSDRINDGGKVICEHESELNLPEITGELILNKEYKHGKVRVSLFTKSPKGSRYE